MRHWLAFLNCIGRLKDFAVVTKLKLILATDGEISHAEVFRLRLSDARIS